ncbi:MAG: hypothetical protein V3W41_21160 [Planctomycetota bacterium]
MKSRIATIVLTQTAGQTKRTAAVLSLVFCMVLVSACDRQAGQPYVITGELTIKSDFNVDPDEINSRGGRVNLMMTVRSGPNIGDVLVQRRWIGIGSRHHFGLGKGDDIVTRIKAKTDRIYVTALLDVYDRGGERITRSYVGWTRDALPVGSDNLVLEIDNAYGQADPRKVKNFPVGGWYSPSATEEAPPPGTAQINPGARAFSGTIDVPEDLRYAFRQFVLYVGAGDDAKATREFKVRARYDTPSFPLNFSLHLNQTASKGSKVIENPKLVVAILDFDGNLATAQDQCRVSTPAPVAPGTTDIKLMIDPRKMLEFIMKRSSPAGGEKAPQKIDASKARSVTKGRIELADELKAMVSGKTTLWLTVRDAASDALVLVKKLSAEFPQDFELRETDTMSGAAMRVEGAFRIRATLTDGDPSGSDPNTIRVTSDVIPGVGATGIVIRLEKSK